MPRAAAILQSEYPYNISARCINKDWFNLPMEIVWEIFSAELNETSSKHDLRIHSFVLMSNHFHLLASTPKANISQCMQHFMSRTSRRLTKAGNRINETFAGRHYKCILQHHGYYLNVYKYNYRNPVVAGICGKPEDYPFSTLKQVINNDYKTVPLLPDLTFQSDPAGTLHWLNQVSNPEKIAAIRTGLKHAYFKSRLCVFSKKPIISESELI